MHHLDVDADVARHVIDEHDGSVRRALEHPPRGNAR
jgi:hypothetical protein